jgi:hypothetical protein
MFFSAFKSILFLIQQKSKWLEQAIVSEFSSQSLEAQRMQQDKTLCSKHKLNYLFFHMASNR